MTTASDWYDTGYRQGRNTPILDDEDDAALLRTAQRLLEDARAIVGPSAQADVGAWAEGYHTARAERLLRGDTSRRDR